MAAVGFTHASVTYRVGSPSTSRRRVRNCVTGRVTGMASGVRVRRSRVGEGTRLRRGEVVVEGRRKTAVLKWVLLLVFSFGVLGPIASWAQPRISSSVALHRDARDPYWLQCA